MSELSANYVYDAAGNRKTFYVRSYVGPLIDDRTFDVSYYLMANPDVAATGADLKAHYDTYGAAERRKPNALFSAQGYLNTYPDVAAAGVDPLHHYNATGWTEGRDPSAAFSTTGYLQSNSDVAAAGVPPLRHYLRSGADEFRCWTNMLDYCRPD